MSYATHPAIPIMKLLASIYFTEIYKKLERRCKSTQIYKNWFTIKDRRLIKKISQFEEMLHSKNVELGDTSLESKALLKYRCQLEEILGSLKLIKGGHDADNPLTSYFYLYDKAIIFLSIATPEEIEKFVAIGKELLNLSK